MAKVSIQNADIKLTIKGKRGLFKWIESVILSEGKELGRVDVVCCSDTYLLDINKRFLNHDYLTDIITFDYSEGNLISGELYISYDRVKENAIEFGVSDFEEFKRVMVHGVLHLCGYGDKTQAEGLEMRRKENEKLLMID